MSLTKKINLTLTIDDDTLDAIKLIFTEKEPEQFSRQDLETIQKAFQSIILDNNNDDQKAIVNSLNILAQADAYAPIDQRSLAEYVRDTILKYEDNGTLDPEDDLYDFVQTVFGSDSACANDRLTDIDAKRDIYAFSDNFPQPFVYDNNDAMEPVNLFATPDLYFLDQLFSFAFSFMTNVIKNVPKNEDGTISINTLKQYLRDDLDIRELEMAIYDL